MYDWHRNKIISVGSEAHWTFLIAKDHSSWYFEANMVKVYWLRLLICLSREELPITLHGCSARDLHVPMACSVWRDHDCSMVLWHVLLVINSTCKLLLLLILRLVHNHDEVNGNVTPVSSTGGFTSNSCEVDIPLNFDCIKTLTLFHVNSFDVCLNANEYMNRGIGLIEYALFRHFVPNVDFTLGKQFQPHILTSDLIA